MEPTVVWKYEVPVDQALLLVTGSQDFSLSIPQHATILDGVHIVNGKPCIYAMVNPDNPMHDYTFHIRGTGIDLGPGCDSHVGTWVEHLSLKEMPQDTVWHLFEDWLMYQMDTFQWAEEEAEPLATPVAVEAAQ